ncbi:hypothetical protein ACEOWJ_004181 [Bacillus cereus]
MGASISLTAFQNSSISFFVVATDFNSDCSISVLLVFAAVVDVVDCSFVFFSVEHAEIVSKHDDNTVNIPIIFSTFSLLL